MAWVAWILMGLALYQASLSHAWLFRRSGSRRANSVCFPEMHPNFRCYKRSSKTMLFLPRSPSQQNIRFDLYTSLNPSTPQHLDAMDANTVKKSNFDASQKVAVVIHGFTQSSTHPEIISLVRELLTVERNVIAVNWDRGAKPPNYPSAVANTRVVGAQLATLIKTLGVDPGRVHLIGFSLGAQVAGFAGDKFGRTSFARKKIGRITGLDPAGPWFQRHGTADKLDPSDASFVDVIHTDGINGGFGMEERAGHVDFYPNGGYKMPGCPYKIQSVFNPSKAADAVSCSHTRAVAYFKASIKSKYFKAYPCDHQRQWRLCKTCGRRGCNRMGYHASAKNNGLFVLGTGATYPY